MGSGWQIRSNGGHDSKLSSFPSASNAFTPDPSVSHGGIRKCRHSYVHDNNGGSQVILHRVLHKPAPLDGFEWQRRNETPPLREEYSMVFFDLLHLSRI